MSKKLAENTAEKRRFHGSIRTALITAFALLVLVCFLLFSLVFAWKSVENTEKQLFIIFAAAILLLAAVIVAFFIGKKLVSSLKSLEEAAKSYSDGSFDVKIKDKATYKEAQEAIDAFNEMLDVLSEKEKQRQNFLGSVSHDLRSPMTSIAGFVDGILDGTIPEEKHEHYLRLVSAETHRLSRLVASLLDITRIQSGKRKFSLEKFDICELLRLILISFETEIDKKKLSVEFLPCEEKCIVLSDKDAIYQVAYNIIHNAIKFTDDEGTLRISVEEHETGKVLIKIYNTGKGIEKEELPYVFERFYRAKGGEKNDKSGSGLGLFIVKTILSSLGESIYADSLENEFCEFGFTLSSAQSKK